MTEREQEIFLKGVSVGMKAINSIEQFLPKEVSKKESTEPVKTRKQRVKRTPWTDEEKKIMIDNPTFSAKELHELIQNHNINSIYAMRSIMGLKKEKVEEVENGLAKLGQ